MKLSTAGRYGLRALLDLVANYRGAAISLAAIAARQRVSPGYLEHMFSALKKAGLVYSTRGSQGGYHPAPGLADKTAGEVLRVLEGDLCIVEMPAAAAAEDPIQRCLRERVWDVLDRGVASVIDSKTLGALARPPSAPTQKS